METSELEVNFSPIDRNFNFKDSLIKICILPKEEALSEWDRWKFWADNNLEKLELKILPEVYLRLSSWGVKDKWIEKFAKIHQSTWAHNQLLLNEVEPLLRKLAYKKIPIMLLKGSAICLKYANDIGYRYFKDIDLLITKGNLAHTEEILIDCKWEKDQTKIGWTKKPYLLDKWDLTSHSLHFTNSRKQILDLHWFTTYCWCKDNFQQGFWERAIPFQYLDIPISLLSPTDSFFNICLHGITQEEKEEKYWIIDIFKILQSQQIDWDLLIQLAKDSHTQILIMKAINTLEQNYILKMPESYKVQLSNDGNYLVDLAESFLEKHGKDTLLGGFPSYLNDYLRAEISSTGRNHFQQFIDFIKLRWKINSSLSLFQEILKRILKKFQFVLFSADRRS